MKIVKTEVGEIRIPLITPFKTALRTVEMVHDIVVRITADDGRVGYGEAPPTAVITGDTLGSIRNAIEEFIAPNLTGMDILCMDEIQSKLHSCTVKNTSAKAAVDMALYDLYSQELGQPLYKVLGGSRDHLETDITISVNSAEEMVSDCLVAIEKGFKVLKIKVGKDGDEDIRRIEAVYNALKDKALLRIDANQGWEPKEAVRIISTLEDKGIPMDLVEQPVRAHDIKGLQYVTEHVYTKVLADECVFSLQDAVNIIQMHAADMINIKLMKTGGIYQALKICSVAEEYNVECMIGCMMESSISVAAAAHLAAAKAVITRVDLDGVSLCAQIPFKGGPKFENALITMNETPGLGFTDVPFDLSK